MAKTKPIATTIVGLDLVEKYPELGWRFVSRPENIFAGGYEWLGQGRASFNSAAVSRTDERRQASFQVLLTKEQAEIYKGSYEDVENSRWEIAWWWFGPSGDPFLPTDTWNRINRRFAGVLINDRLTGSRVLAGSVISNPWYSLFEPRFLTNEDHQDEFPGDRGLGAIKRFATGPRVL